jgi:flavin reductase (DIM6/NTAB) family NADH-FMN oxidoreductase RutF
MIAMRLPMPLQRWIRGLPQWSPVGVKQPQQAVRVRMSSARGECDITCGIVVAALKPLTFAIAVTEQTRSVLADPSGPHLQFIDLESGRAVGLLHLNHLRDWDTSGFTLGLFEVRDGTQRCLRWPYRSWNRWLQNRAMQKKTDSDNFYMPPEAVQQLMIFYICPRPVVLVSVDDGSHSNLFPMDLIGPVSADHFTLALRSTSQSVPTMKSVRRVALADIPASARSTAYKLGVHHKKAVDWDQLPFSIGRSPIFGLPYPQIALRLREVEILDFDTIGSHTFFVTRIASELVVAEAPRFFHTSGIYQHYRTRNGYPFAAAP